MSYQLVSILLISQDPFPNQPVLLSPFIMTVWDLVFSGLIEMVFSQVVCAFIYDFLVVVKINTT